jgi:hypothetical protein
MSIYAAPGVPEVWRLDPKGLVFHILEADAYKSRARSRAFPKLSSKELLSFLAQLDEVGATALTIQFREWVRNVFLNRLRK